MAPISAKLGQNAFQTIPVKSIFGRKKKKLTKNFGVGQYFLPLWINFGGRTGKRTSKLSSSQFFALDALIIRSVRPKIDEKMSVAAARTIGGVQVFRGTTTWLRDYGKTDGRGATTRWGVLRHGRYVNGRFGPQKFSLNLIPRACVSLQHLASNWPCGLVSASEI